MGRTISVSHARQRTERQDRDDNQGSNEGGDDDSDAME
jgi:hypothetical protein